MQEIRQSLFGAIAVVSDYISEEQLYECLNAQRMAGEDSPLLGEIMKERGYIDDEGIDDILTIQRRVSTGYFGEIAVRLKYATVDQIEEALLLQRRERLNGKKPGTLGEILVEYEIITSSDLKTILQAQEDHSVNCPGCGLRLSVWKARPGQVINCSDCNAAITWQTEEAETPSAKADPPPDPGDDPEPESENIPDSEEKDPDTDGTAEGVLEVPGYTIKHIIKERPDSIVYEAEQETTGWRMAIEYITSITTDNKDFLRRFHEDAQKAIRLNHPAVIQIFGVGDSGGHPYIITDYLESEGLNEILEREKKLPRLGAVEFALHIANGLHAAHEADLVHGGLAPDLVRIASDGTIKLARLGIAKQFDQDLLLETISSDSVSCLAPEQIIGKHIPDRRSDVYALGVLLFRMLTGYVPYPGDSPREILLNVSGGVKAVLRDSDLPGYFCALLERMIAMDRDMRYEDCTHVLDHLELIKKKLS